MTKICEVFYREVRDENHPHAPLRISGLRPATGGLFFFPWPTSCGFGGLVENGLALRTAVDNADPLQSLTGCLLVDVTIPQRNAQDRVKWRPAMVR